MTTLTGWLPIINLVFIIGVPIGLAIGIRSGFDKAAKAAEARVRAALTEENTVLERKVTRLEKEIARMRKTLITIGRILDGQGLHIEVSDDVVTLTDERARRGKTIHVHIDSGELPAIDEKKEE
jgi:hypothetical protein